MLVYNGPVRANAQGEELYGHGTADFPCGCYNNDPLASEIPWHWHAECEAVVVTYDELVFLAGGTAYHLRTGDAAFVNAGCLTPSRPGRAPTRSRATSCFTRGRSTARPTPICGRST